MAVRTAEPGDVEVVVEVELELVVDEDVVLVDVEPALVELLAPWIAVPSACWSNWI
jgi:hypothetical protein